MKAVADTSWSDRKTGYDGKNSQEGMMTDKA